MGDSSAKDYAEILAKVPPISRGWIPSAPRHIPLYEAISIVAGEAFNPYSDLSPACASQAILNFAGPWLYSVPEEEVDALARPLVLRLIGTAANSSIERRRSIICGDWLIREYTPIWLRLIKMDERADILAGLPEVTDFADPRVVALLASAEIDVSSSLRESSPHTYGIPWAAWFCVRNCLERNGIATSATEIDEACKALSKANGVCLRAIMMAVSMYGLDVVNDVKRKTWQSALELIDRMIEIRG